MYGNEENITEKAEWISKNEKGENTNSFTQSNTKKITNRKTLGHDSIHKLWLRKFTSIKTCYRNKKKILEAGVLEWMTKGKTILIRKGLLKGIAPNNCRLITCIPMENDNGTQKRGDL